jgi:threonine dehydratase
VSRCPRNRVNSNQTQGSSECRERTSACFRIPASEMIRTVTVAPSLDLVREAQRAIRGIAVRTPLVRLNVLDSAREVFLKLENLQPIGAFKTRGATFAMQQMPRAQLERGVLTASAGNMAQAVAWSAKQAGVPCTVIAPETAPATKLDAVRRLGGRIVLVPFDRWWQTLIDRSYPGVSGTFIHPFDDLHMMAGSGTIAIEILEDLPDVETILVPWGGGGLSIGIGAAIRALRPSCEIFAVEVDTAAPLAASLKAFTPVTVDYRASFIDGIGSKTVMPSMFRLANDYLAGSLVTSVEDVAATVRVLAERNRIVTEGAGAAAVAVAMSGQAGSGRTVCIVSGGNIDTHKLAVILGGATP